MGYHASQLQFFFFTTLFRQNCIYPEEYEGHFDTLMISRDEIMQAVRSLANQITKDYKDKGCRPVMVCVLKGANPVRLSNTRKMIKLIGCVFHDFVPFEFSHYGFFALH